MQRFLPVPNLEQIHIFVFRVELFGVNIHRKLRGLGNYDNPYYGIIRIRLSYQVKPFEKTDN